MAEPAPNQSNNQAQQKTSPVNPQWDENKFSVSVNNVLKTVLQQHGDKANLILIAEMLFKSHQEYAYDKNNSLFAEFISKLQTNQSALSLPPMTSASCATMVLDIVKPPASPPVVNGRVFLMALVLVHHIPISNTISDRADWNKMCKTLVRKLQEELLSTERIKAEDLLTANGKVLWRRLMEQSQGNLYETANVSDRPAAKDFLSRDALAQYIGNRLRHIFRNDITQNNNGSFFMHIDGAWGSGKSTLLGFLKNHLENDTAQSKDGWVVVEFNAWQNQRLDPPWWFLMKSVHKQAMAGLKKKKDFWGRINLRNREWLWRLNTGSNNLVAAIITLTLFIITITIGVKDENSWMAQPIIQLATFAGFLWTQTKFLRTSLVAGSARAAQTFIEENGKDPLNTLATHFTKQVHRIKRPMAIFIDDLDRCNKDYGIKLLEGLQTIFRDAPVVYIIAADRRWLSIMYEEQYKMFSNAIAQPAKRFGLVFLDKTFQLIVELPNISALQKERYWNYLLNIAEEEQNKDVGQMREEANTKLQSAVNNSEKLKTIDSAGNSVAENQIMREQIISSINIGEEDRYLEHKLQKFIPIIEPNPRVMKRIINDISTAKAITFLYNQDINEDQLILWTILKQQHPSLAEYFWEEPQQLKLVGKNENAITGNTQFDSLLKQSEVKNLFRYTLDKQTIEIDADFINKMRFESVTLV